MNLSTLFFGIVAVIIATLSIFFDNVEASASPDALAAPDALADAEALPLALPSAGRRSRGNRGSERIYGGVYNPQSRGVDVGRLSDDIFIQQARQELADALARERAERAKAQRARG
uniref:Venom peptide n=1 Tax=Dasymutilla sicheliana TaxID=1175388 RepID=A0A8T9VQR5_DASSI|nr:venom peptide precursor [Dasymutilla sicheliana]